VTETKKMKLKQIILLVSQVSDLVQNEQKVTNGRLPCLRNSNHTFDVRMQPHSHIVLRQL